MDSIKLQMMSAMCASDRLHKERFPSQDPERMLAGVDVDHLRAGGQRDLLAERKLTHVTLQWWGGSVVGMQGSCTKRNHRLLVLLLGKSKRRLDAGRGVEDRLAEHRDEVALLEHVPCVRYCGQGEEFPQGVLGKCCRVYVQVCIGVYGHTYRCMAVT